MTNAPLKTARYSLYRDRSFVGIVITQFLGAFNDNFFKQAVLLLALRGMKAGDKDPQSTAAILFSLPFILFSGYCGYLSDLRSKRSIVVLSKVLEIAVMGLGVAGFLLGSIPLLYFILFLMGAQSALFGPSKYGILPELFPDDQLPRANGWIIMTTFLAIILALPAAGWVTEQVGDRVWIAGALAVAIAVAGTVASLLIRPTPIARPDLKFEPSALFVSHDTRAVLLNDRRLLWALAATSLFWTAGGMVYPNATNRLGKDHFGLGEFHIGQLAACTGIGIAFGCVIAGVASRGRFRAGMVSLGMFGMAGSLVLLGLPGPARGGTLLGLEGSAAMLTVLGLFAGIFNVPVTSFLQARTPEGFKGQIIGVMNLANFSGMFLAGVMYRLVDMAFLALDIPPARLFLAAACILLPLLAFYRPRSESFGEDATGGAD